MFSTKVEKPSPRLVFIHPGQILESLRELFKYASTGLQPWLVKSEPQGCVGPELYSGFTSFPGDINVKPDLRIFFSPRDSVFDRWNIVEQQENPELSREGRIVNNAVLGATLWLWILLF